MAPLSAKALEREDLPSPELVRGCLESVLNAHYRLEHVLKLADIHARGLLLERALGSTKQLLDVLREARRAAAPQSVAAPVRRLFRAIAVSWEWIADPFREEEPLDVPVGLEDIHELSGGKLEEPRL